MPWCTQTLCVNVSYKGYIGYDVMIRQKAIQSRIASIGPISIPDITLGDLKNVGCGCPDCTRLLVPIFTQRREPKIGIPLAGKEEVQKHFEERLELTRKWGVLWNVTWQGKLQVRFAALCTSRNSNNVLCR